MIRVVNQGKFKATKVASKLMHSSSTQTIRRTLKKSGLFEYSKMKSAPYLKKHHKKSGAVCISKIINLDGPDCIHSY